MTRLENEDDDKILKDGQVRRVSMMMMDSVSKEVAAIAAAVAVRPFVADHHMPRHAVLADEQRNAVVERQAAYERRLTDAWKNPPGDWHPAPAPPSSPVAPLLAPLLAPTLTADQLQSRRDAAQRRYDERMRDAWRNPEGAI